MGNRRNRRSGSLESPSPERETRDTQIETSNTGNATLTNSNVIVQEVLRDRNSQNQLTETSQISNGSQVETQIIEQKNNDKIVKMREEMDTKFEAISKEIRTNKNASTVKNLKSESNETQKSQYTGSKTDKSIGVGVSNYENSVSENEDYPLKASEMKDLN